MRRIVALLSLAVASVACSSSSSPGGGEVDSGTQDSGSGNDSGTSLTPDTFVAQLPAAYCSVYFRCCKTTEIPHVGILSANNITTQAQCTASSAVASALRFQCLPAEVNQYHAMTFDAQKAAACLSDIQNAPCGGGLVTELWGSTNCQGAFVGSLPLGSQCSASHCTVNLASASKPNSECASGDCNSSGVCANPSPIGGTCSTDSDCVSGSWCSSLRTCTKATAAGGACTQFDQCEFPQACFTSPGGGNACELVCTGP